MQERATITLLPFEEQDTSFARIASEDDWYLNIKLESKNQINHSTVLREEKTRKQWSRNIRCSHISGIEKNISIAMDLDGSSSLNI